MAVVSKPSASFNRFGSLGPKMAYGGLTRGPGRRESRHETAP